MWGLSDAIKGERWLVITLYIVEDYAYFRWCQRKCGAEQELASVPIPLKIILFSPPSSTAAHNLSQVWEEKKPKNNAILFDVGSKHIC